MAQTFPWIQVFFCNKPAVIVIVLDSCVRSATDNCYRSSPKDFFYECLDVWGVRLIIKCRTSLHTNNPIKLLPSRQKRLRKRTHGKNSCDQSTTGSIGPCTEK